MMSSRAIASLLLGLVACSSPGASSGASSGSSGASSSRASSSSASTRTSTPAMTEGDGGGTADASDATRGATCAAPVYTTSDPQGGMTFGSYYVFNDMWNTSATLGPQTLYACSATDWYVVSKQSDQQGAVLTYPNVQENFSQALSSFHTITSTFAETSPHVGIYEDAYDIWFNGFGAGHTEIMIWVDNEKQVPAGSKVDTTTQGGKTYDVYRTSDGSYVALVASQTFTSGTIDLLQIFDYLVGKSWLTSTDALSQIDFGVEIVDTAGANATFVFTDFSITSN